MVQRVWLSTLLVGVVMVGGCKSSSMCCDKEGEEKDEVKMKFADVPAPVQATLTKEAGGAAIASVDKETDDGKTIYEADVMSGGKNWEIKVAADGKLISKKIDNEEDEKGEKGEKKGEKEDDEKKM